MTFLEGNRLKKNLLNRYCKIIYYISIAIITLKGLINNFFNNKKVKGNYIIISIIILIFLYPFISYPLIETTLTNIYERSFIGIDSSLILKTFKSVLFVYMWTDQAYGLIMRSITLSASYLFGLYMLDVEIKLRYREIILVLFFAEIILILGNYLTVIFNYAQFKFGLGSVKVFESPLNLSYYFTSIPIYSHKYLMLSSINLFTLIYFYILHRFLSRKYYNNKVELIIITIFVFFIFILIKIFNPVSKFFFNSPGVIINK